MRQEVKRYLPIEFVPQPLTSYGGLELLHRYVRRLGLYPRLRRACADLGGDYGGGRISLLVARRFLFWAGAGGGLLALFFRFLVLPLSSGSRCLTHAPLSTATALT